jgi:hypothetical protein
MCDCENVGDFYGRYDSYGGRCERCWNIYECILYDRSRKVVSGIRKSQDELHQEATQNLQKALKRSR